MLDWDKLRIFKAVAEAGSFTHAGETLNLSQSAISRQISALEKSIGQPLFHRHARGLILTEQGEMLMHTTCNVFDQLQTVQMRLSDSKVRAEGPLTLTTVEFIASTWLAPQISSFKEKYPDIQLSLLLDDRIYDLHRRDADVAIRLQKAEHSDLIERHIKTIDFVLCASTKYLDKAGRPKSINDFQNHTMIGYPQYMHTPFIRPNWIFNRLNIDTQNNPKIILLNSMHTRQTAIDHDCGISVLPRYIVEHDPALEVIMPDLEIPSVDMYFVYPQERRNSKRISVLKEFIFDQIKN